ncbi:uncharacterized protein LOC127078931 [Lathyrus oleraceus]|uniref:uncharacterized protein LOC127078931 n=1 Tax=Pisum sativum TaxID=3888 RepID=UPI0021CE5B59|nr:uncharacterized protein LOC127078931 [Pisum sativum]
MSKIAATQVESDNSIPGVEGNKDGVAAATETTCKSSSIPDVLNNTDEPTYRPSSEKISMSDSPNVKGANTTALGGDDAQDEELREDEEEVEEPPIFDDADDVDDDDELKDQDDNGEGGQGEINEGQPQGQTSTTPTTKVILEGFRDLTRAPEGLSSEELAALKQSQSLEYMKAIALLSQVNLLDVSPEVANIILELGTMIEQVIEDNKMLPQITKEIEHKSGAEATAWDATSESTNKALELEETKKKNQAKIENYDCHIS